MSYGRGYNVPPGIVPRTSKHAEELKYCHNPVCREFNEPVDVITFHEEDTNAYYDIPEECVACGGSWHDHYWEPREAQEIAEEIMELLSKATEDPDRYPEVCAAWERLGELWAEAEVGGNLTEVGLLVFSEEYRA